MDLVSFLRVWVLLVVVLESSSLSFCESELWTLRHFFFIRSYFPPKLSRKANHAFVKNVLPSNRFVVVCASSASSAFVELSSARFPSQNIVRIF